MACGASPRIIAAMPRFLVVVSTLLLLAMVLVLARALGQRRWHWRTQALLNQLNRSGLMDTTAQAGPAGPPAGQQAARPPLQPATVDLARDLAGLPPPVQRWFRAALTDGLPRGAAVQLTHQGQFNLGQHGERWRPFTSTQHVLTQRPGFVWDARIRLLPGVQVHVHDAYLAGEGVLHPAVAGLLSLANLRGGGDLAQGELMRWVAEAAWYPAALLPGPAVQWQAVDTAHARVTVHDGAVQASLVFGFDDEGRLLSCRADARGRTVGGRTVPTPWEGRWWGHQRVRGQVLPLQGEVAWLLPQGRQPYWQGRVTAWCDERV